MKGAMPGGTESGEAKIVVPARKLSQPKAPWKPGADHPWRKPFKIHMRLFRNEGILSEVLEQHRS
jgi:hypothetical protein